MSVTLFRPTRFKQYKMGVKRQAELALVEPCCSSRCPFGTQRRVEVTVTIKKGKFKLDISGIMALPP